MIIDFYIRNYASFKDEQHFSLLATAKKEKFEGSELNIATLPNGLRLLKTAVLYGANASGKSNFLKSFNVLKQLVFSIGNIENSNSKLRINRFLLCKETKNEPTLIEISFLIEDTIYRYGVEMSDELILGEWLYKKHKRETLVFHREGKYLDTLEKQTIINEVWKKKMVRDDTLLLTIAAQFNDPLSDMLLKEFLKINVISGIYDASYKDFTIDLFSNKEESYKNEIIELLKLADFGIENLRTREEAGEAVSVSIKGNDNKEPIIHREATNIKSLFTTRKVYSDKGKVVGEIEMSFNKYESEGTQKFFHLLGPILLSLKKGQLLVIDELDTKLHPLLTKQIIRLFRNPKTNPNNAQLVFATHDINLLESKLFRRDQIWFTEKDRFGASQLISLSDFKKGVRNDEKISKRYLEGRYGAIPYLNDFEEYYETSMSK